MADYRFDLLEADPDTNIALDNLANELGKLYHESWEADKRATYDKPFRLDINTFSTLWFMRRLKVFIAYDKQENPVGFLIGMTVRPMPYEASVFQIEDWYTRGNVQMETDLFKHVVDAIRVIGIDEIVVNDGGHRQPPLPSSWYEANTFTIRRYLRKE